MISSHLISFIHLACGRHFLFNLCSVANLTFHQYCTENTPYISGAVSSTTICYTTIFEHFIDHDQLINHSSIAYNIMAVRG